jgi:outer membrane protein TolC
MCSITSLSRYLIVTFSACTIIGFLKSDAQQISIDSAYAGAEQNYPLIKKAGLITQSETYSIANISKGYLPQVSINTQATYQSAVTSISGIPNVPIEPLSKDQYKAYADVTQTIYDGGVMHAEKQIQKVSSQLETANLQKDLYLIHDRINQLFFGALLLQVQISQNNLLIKQLTDTKTRVDSAIKNGAAFKSDAEDLQSEILIQNQHGYDLESALTSYLQMLEAFTGKKINDATQLEAPEINNEWLAQNNRPELKIFSLQNKLYDEQIHLLSSRVRPKLSLFGEGGYGKPGLNQLKNQFDWFYIAGIKLNWSFSSLYTLKNEKKIWQLDKEKTNADRETFLFNNNLTMLQQNNEKQKTDKLIASDAEIIRLKQNIQQAAKAKYENGVITLNDYLKDINDVNRAQLNLELHKIQSLLNQYNRKITSGN